MRSRWTPVLGAALAFACAVPDAAAQHFAAPKPIDPDEVERVGEPAFTLARPTTSFGAAVAGEWLYVLGGYTGRPHDYHRAAQADDFVRINLLAPGHVEALPNGQRVQGSPLEAWREGIVRTGGMEILNAEGEPQRLRSLDAVAMFDPVAGSWRDLPALPRARSSHDTAILGSTLHVTGGWTLDPQRDQRVWADDMLLLDLERPEAGWTRVPAPFRRRALASVAIAGRLVVIGGMDAETGRPTSRVDVYEPATDTWSRGPDFPTGAFGVAAAVVGDEIVASGADGRVFTWQPGAGSTWTERAALTFPRFFHQIVAGPDEGEAWFLGGISRGVRPAHVERVALDDERSPAPAADPVVAHWIVPAPGEARNRQGLFMHDGRLHAFGGNDSTGQHDFEPDNFLAEGYRLALADLAWSPMPDLPTARQSISTAFSADGEQVLALGGFAHDGEVARTFADGFVLDLDEPGWTSCGPLLPKSRSQFGLARHGDRWWVFGGLDYDPKRASGERFDHLVPVLAADATARCPEFVDPGLRLPRPRRAFGGAVLDGRYHLVGGMTDDFRIVETCDVFDFESGTFETMPAPARPRLSPQLVALGGRLYLAGGSSPKADGTGLEPNPTIEVFDPETGRWTTHLAEIPVTPRHLRMMPFRGRLLLFSTHVEDRSVAHLVLVDPLRAVEEGARVAQHEGS